MAIQFGDSTSQSTAGAVGVKRVDEYRLTGRTTSGSNYNIYVGNDNAWRISFGDRTISSSAIDGASGLWVPFTSYSVPSGATRINLKAFIKCFGEDNNYADYYAIAMCVRHGSTWSLADYTFIGDGGTELGNNLSQWGSVNDMVYNLSMGADVSATNFNAVKFFGFSDNSNGGTLVINDMYNGTGNYNTQLYTSTLEVTAY